VSDYGPVLSSSGAARSARPVLVGSITVFMSIDKAKTLQTKGFGRSVEGLHMSTTPGRSSERHSSPLLFLASSSSKRAESGWIAMSASMMSRATSIASRSRRWRFPVAQVSSDSLSMYSVTRN
jgi:hypothetical protein